MNPVPATSRNPHPYRWGFFLFYARIRSLHIVLP